MISRFDRSAVKHYGAALGFIGAATILTIAVEPLFGGRAPLFFFILAVAFSAAYGGIGPGLAATAAGIALVYGFFEAQMLVLSLPHSGPILFGALAIGLAVVIGQLKNSNARLTEANREIELANDKLAERGRALTQANEELQRFAYALAHDLNTPLRGIAALTDLFVQRNRHVVDESSKECAEMIVSRVQRMQAMIKGLLDYAAVVEKSEARADVDCNAVVERVLQDLESAIAECDAHITVDALPLVPATESHLHQVFSNLISNAIKYRPSVRTPQIHVSAEERRHDWMFCVADNGIGVDMRFAEDIFGMFKRLHGDREYEGSGIGLALCKIVVQRHGGNIWVESELGQGSKFFFTIPKRAQSTVESATAKVAGATRV